MCTKLQWFLPGQCTDSQTEQPASTNALIQAANDGRSEKIDKILREAGDKGKALKSTNANGETALHRAALKGHKDAVARLIELGADVMAKRKDFSSPLHLATLSNHLQVVIELLKAKDKLEIDAEDEKGFTALHLAARDGWNDIVIKLGEHKANIEAENKEKRTPLSYAASHGKKQVVETLLTTFSAKIRSPDEDGWDPLHFAAYRGHKDVVQVLLDSYEGEHTEILEAKTTRGRVTGRTPLHQAVRNGHEGAVQVLLSKKPRLDLVDSETNTPVHIACTHNSEQIALLLLKANADFSTENANFDSGFYLACRNGLKHLVQQILDQEKLDLKFIKNTPSRKSKLSAFYKTTEHGHEDIAMMLLRKGAPHVEISSQNGTPLHWAARNGQEQVVQYLLSERKISKDEIGRLSGGQTPLHWAAAGKSATNVDIVLMMLEYMGGDQVTQQRRQDEWTVLHWAAAFGDAKLVQLLVSAGSSTRIKINALTLDGKMAADVAQVLEVPNNDSQRRREKVSILEWLRIPAAVPTNRITPELTAPVQPGDDLKGICDETYPTMMDFYRQGSETYSLERSNFSLCEVVHDYGPELIMSEAAKHQETPLKPEDLLFRWIHLPANHVGL